MQSPGFRGGFRQPSPPCRCDGAFHVLASAAVCSYVFLFPKGLRSTCSMHSIAFYVFSRPLFHLIMAFPWDRVSISDGHRRFLASTAWRFRLWGLLGWASIPKPLLLSHATLENLLNGRVPQFLCPGKGRGCAELLRLL